MAQTSDGPSGVVETIVADLATPARFDKAIRRLRALGGLTGEARDIGPLLKELDAALDAECKAWAAQQLVEHFWRDIKRRVSGSFPEYYKEKLSCRPDLQV